MAYADTFLKSKTQKMFLTETDRGAFMAKVYSWMTLGVGITAFTAMFMVSSGLATVLLSNMGLYLGLCLLELGLVFGYSLIQPSFEVSVCILGLYASLNGITFSALFLLYGLGVAAEAFGVTAGMFAMMAFIGHTTKKDLSGLQTFFTMSLIGLLLLLIVEMFVASSMFSLMVSGLAILLFAGLTAYDAQKIKDMQISNKNALDGALMLYLDFINMFIHVMRILGRARD